MANSFTEKHVFFNYILVQFGEQYVIYYIFNASMF